MKRRDDITHILFPYYAIRFTQTGKVPTSCLLKNLLSAAERHQSKECRNTCNACKDFAQADHWIFYCVLNLNKQISGLYLGPKYSSGWKLSFCDSQVSPLDTWCGCTIREIHDFAITRFTHFTHFKKPGSNLIGDDCNTFHRQSWSIQPFLLLFWFSEPQWQSTPWKFVQTL